MPVVLKVDFDVVAKYHDSNHCSEGNKEVYSNTTHNVKPPSKKFINDNFNDCGEYVGCDISKLNYSNEYPYASCSMCGGSRTYTATDARIIYEDDTLLKKMLDGMSSDEEVPLKITNSVPRFLSPGYKARCGKILCNWGSKCNRKNDPNNPCYYKHD
jgi:hypothetical protein